MTFEEGNQAGLRHGAGGAEKSLTQGTPMAGVAREQELRVTAELEIEGIGSMERRNAIRLQTVADLYYQAILGADNLEDLDKFVKRFGWIAGSTMRAWQQVRDAESKRKDKDITELLGGGE